MCLGSNYGVKINKSKILINKFEYFFGEDQGRYVAELDQNNLAKVEKILKKKNIFYEIIGATQKDYFEVQSEFKLDTKDLYKINNKWYNRY